MLMIKTLTSVLMVSTYIINCITTRRFGLLLYQNSSYRTLMDISIYVCLDLHNYGYSICIYNHNSLHISIDPVMKSIDFYFSLKSAIENTYVDESYNREIVICFNYLCLFGIYTPALQRGRGVYCFTSVRPSLLPSVQDIFHRIFLSNC